MNENNEFLKTTQNYIITFLKAPISTIQKRDLNFTGAVVLLGLLPFALFLAIWSFLNQFINTAVILVSSSFGGLGSFLTPNAANIRAEAMMQINWGLVFFGALTLVATWFSLMIFVPILITKFMKDAEPVCLKVLFSKTAASTIPMTILFLVATILGFVHLATWILPFVIALVIPILLHLFVVGLLWRLGADKTTYIVLVTQVIVAISVSLIAAMFVRLIGGLLLEGMFW